MACIYIHTNKINNKKYVGITKDSSPERRWGKSGDGYKGSYFYEEGILKFGWENFDHDYWEVPSYDDVQQLEARLIKHLKSDNNKYGYNDSPGVAIRNNNTLDVFAQTIITKLTKETDTEELLLKTEYRYTTNQYEINYLVSLNNSGRINTDLDCQRGYTWTEERQQGLWDTLLFGHRIPEFHAIRVGLKYDIIDGKQRITTILKIINNEIECKKAYANEKLIPLFTLLNKSSFYFQDLPIDLQNRILNTPINIAEYSDISDSDMVALFRKLNASMPLSDFAKGIANHITMRLDFTRFLINHPSLNKVYTESRRRAGDDEKMLIRLAVLLKEEGKADLTPNNLCKFYPLFTKKELLDIKNKILDCLNKVESHLDLLRGFRSINSYFPLICYIIINHDLTETEIIDFFKKIRKENYPGRGDDQHTTTVVNRLNALRELL